MHLLLTLQSLVLDSSDSICMDPSMTILHILVTVFRFLQYIDAGCAALMWHDMSILQCSSGQIIDDVQDAWDAKSCAAEFQLSCKHLLQHLRTSGAKKLESSDVSVGRQLLLFDEPDRGLLKGVHWAPVFLCYRYNGMFRILSVALRCKGYVICPPCALRVRQQH